MRLLFCFLFSVLLSHASFSQGTDCHRHIPYFRSLKVEKLSYRLTKHLKTDSAKVCAIHSWMTRHIKYDVKKYLAFDYSTIPLNRILRKRKATCMGFSELFNKLCEFAQVKSTSVQGYAKDVNVDLNDKFYLDEHIWNAVFVNGEWKLIDVSWDAGYVKYYRRTFLGFFIHTFTLGHYDKLKYKPHFITFPVGTYFYKNGTYFATDHIPANPIWQLTNPIKTIEQAEKDSAHYFRRFYIAPTTKDYLTGEQMMNSNLDPEEREISDGFGKYGFNHKNQYFIGNSYSLLAEKIVKKIDPKTTDTLGLLRQCDTISMRLDKAIMHYDSNSFFLFRQKTELAANNDKKKSIMTVQNQPLISSTKIAARNIESGRSLGISGKKLTKSIRKTNRSRLKQLNKSNTFYNAKQSEKPRPLDSAAASLKINILLDSLAQVESKIIQRFKRLDSLYAFCMKRIGQYSVCSASNKNTEGWLFLARMYYEDDLDYYLRTVKDTLMKHKFKDDSLLLSKNGVFIGKLFYSEFVKLKGDFNNLYNCRKGLSTEYTKLKKYTIMGNNIPEQYSQNLEVYKKTTEVCNNLMSIYNKRFSDLKKICKRQRKPTRKELKSYIKEKSLELKMYSIRSSYINKHYRALSGVNKKRLKNCEKTKGRIQKLKDKFKRK